MGYSSFKKSKKLFESWRKYITETVDEAIVDVVSDKLADVFDEQGKLIPEVVEVINDAIGKLKQWLAADHPDLKIAEIFVVGAAVTYQFGPGSDIDVNVVIPGLGQKRKLVDDWMEANLVYPDFKGDGSSRPYQFKPTDTNQGYKHVDGAYEPLQQKWLKKPDLAKAKEMYKGKMGDDSREREAYKKVEANVQKHFKQLYSVLESSSDPREIYKACMVAYQRKAAMKAMRSQSYDNDIEKGYVSQNWGFTNVIYKMLDREGYMDVFAILKKIKGNKSLVQDESTISKLKASLEAVINDPIGWGGTRYDKAAE